MAEKIDAEAFDAPPSDDDLRSLEEALAAGPRVIPEMYSGDLGSKVFMFSGLDKKGFLGLLTALGGSFRKVCYDLAKGVAALMAPSQAHEMTSRDICHLVVQVCNSQNLAVVELGSTRKRREDGLGAAEPDESFFIGPKAVNYYVTVDELGLAQARKNSATWPADLVVEVEHEHRDVDKREIYSCAGAKELWEIATVERGREYAVYALDEKGGYERVEFSNIIKGLRADRIEPAYRELVGLAARQRTNAGMVAPLDSVLKAAGLTALRGRVRERQVGDYGP